MSVATDRPGRSRPMPTAVPPGLSATRDRWAWKLRPGWPLTASFVGFPLWWVLGISSFIGFIAAAFMAAELVRRRRIRVPSGFGWWLVFLLWVAVGVLLLQVDAPGAVPNSSSSRYITWAYRLAWYVSATVAMLYVGNMRRELSTQRITRTFGLMFLVVAAGGWLGILLPHLDFPWFLEVVLPRRAMNVRFLHFLVHPQVSRASTTAP